MNTVFIALGSNMGDRAENLTAAVVAMASYGLTLIQSSRIYETSPWGFESDTPFLNQVVKIQTPFHPEKLLQMLLEIEHHLGRTRISDPDNKLPYQSRVIDLDILLYNNDIYQRPHLTIPHPRMHLRRFVLAPLTELAPDHRHPLLDVSLTELLKNTPDKGSVSLFATCPPVNDTFFLS
jgi:2-amino-4-hydroxy-6-hydroxymethyldihydropteridine diphosphokinase